MTLIRRRLSAQSCCTLCGRTRLSAIVFWLALAGYFLGSSGSANAKVPGGQLRGSGSDGRGSNRHDGFVLSCARVACPT